MSRSNYNLFELDVEKLFENKKLEEIIEVEKLLETEIEKKRVELRSMVGDRYKDVLTASDEIIHMKTISEEIVANIKDITRRCTNITSKASVNVEKSLPVDQRKIEERTIIIQIRLAMILIEHIWHSLDKDNHCKATQYYLLAQHIYTGLSLLKQEHIERIPILRSVRSSLEDLRNRILKKVRKKLENVELSAAEIGNNLNALILLVWFQNSSELLKTFIEHRKIALSTVIKSSYPNVRMQISAMVRCLTATVHLLHDCFIRSGNSDKGLIWQHLDEIISENSPTTLSKVELPSTPLVFYIPEVIKQFRPKCNNTSSVPEQEEIKVLIEDWLENTGEMVRDGLARSLELVTNLKGLHIIREEALKVELPENWVNICAQTNLPEKFSVWFYFFQSLISKRAETLIVKKLSQILEFLQNEMMHNLNENNRVCTDTRNFLWSEDVNDVSRTENNHLGLSMKIKGFSQSIVDVCFKIDEKYSELLQDVSFYIYGDDKLISFAFKDLRTDKKFVDRNTLENTVRTECVRNAERLISFLDDFLRKEKYKNEFVSKSVTSARFLQGLLTLCSNFNKCCSLNGSNQEWATVGAIFNKFSLKLWRNWVVHGSQQSENAALDSLVKLTVRDSLKIFLKWETIEIQEQTEERVFKSQIKVPSQPSVPLQQILTKMHENVNSVLPHSIPKQIHLEYIEANVDKILDQYSKVIDNVANQTQALQFLFDVKFITTFCVPRENIQLVSKSQEICDKLRAKIDPFDLDVFYSYLQDNVKKCVGQSQVILGCLLPSAGQLSSLGVPEKSKEQEKDPSLMALSVPSVNSWFPLLPVTAPSQKIQSSTQQRVVKSSSARVTKSPSKKLQDASNSVRSGAAALFGGLTTDWFS